MAKLAFNPNQILFKELFVGTLIYAVVLGFFNDYTSIVSATSFSIIFFSSVVLQVLTSLAFMLKTSIISWLQNREGVLYKILMIFFVWLVMFASKFVFIWAIDFTFGNNIEINGFFGILLIVLSVTAVHRVADYVFIKLG